MMTDRQAGVAMVAVVDLAAAMRAGEPVTPLREKAQRILDACNGDPISALCLMAVAIPEDLDAWWQKEQPPETTLARRIEVGIANGETLEQIGCSPEQYEVVLNRMDRLAG